MPDIKTTWWWIWQEWISIIIRDHLMMLSCKQLMQLSIVVVESPPLIVMRSLFINKLAKWLAELSFPTEVDQSEETTQTSTKSYKITMLSESIKIRWIPLIIAIATSNNIIPQGVGFLILVASWRRLITWMILNLGLCKIWISKLRNKIIIKR